MYKIQGLQHCNLTINFPESEQITNIHSHK
uniref:Uncharacterized protein n=1 Tax=Arundo donax TaxID=35708 RepID=A0A0A8YY66_ARUDO